MKLIKTIIKFT